LFGAGFDVNETYLCLFEDLLGNNWNQSTQPVNSSQFSFILQSWGQTYSATRTKVTILKAPGNRLINGEAWFDFKVEWAVKAFYVNDSLSSLVLEIVGSGFNVSSYYTCDLRNSAEIPATSIASTAFPTNATQILFLLRDWRFQEVLNLSLLNDKNIPICMNGDVSLKRCSGQAVITLNQTGFLLQPSSGSAEGGQSLIVKGSGFNTYSNSYSCRFVALRNKSVDFIMPATVSDFSHLSCKTPKVSVAGDYNVKVLNGVNTIPVRGYPEGFSFFITEVIQYLNHVCPPIAHLQQ
jgi:hypothetical protein